MNTLYPSFLTALELVAGLDPALWSIVRRSLAVSATACALSFGAGLALGAWLARMLMPYRAPATFEPNRAALRELGLTDREVEVLAILAAGDSNKVIARRLGISPHTVKTHLERIFEKLSANDRAQAVAIAIRTGIVH